MNNKQRYGINIKKYCSAHEAYVEACLTGGSRLDGLLSLHERKLRRLQHERLVHLIVTLLISIVFLFSIWLFVTLSNPLVLILTAVVLALLAAYIGHYFFLENTVQRWYVLSDRISEKISE
ncbi:MAG: hypothetical protein GXY05_07725 [Clostridiales bacterium]|nr:hypothetical protein [Clostridiales bacterium]